jgi:UDP-N-acetylglucosamine--N-acetylmuramyl-(pentapeptide) pyrophosphoryl-undecaprenol N-acetylglucosamine transferase
MRIILTGGGTAGHINPALSIGHKIMKENPEAEILYVGTERGLESELVPKAGMKFESITVKGFRRKLSLDTLKSLYAMVKGILDSWRIIRRFKPDLVIGTGGYVCGPVVFVAAVCRKKTIIHEQNAFPGATNKILSRFVNKVMISYEESERYFKTKSKLVYTGNPVRAEFIELNRDACREKLNLKDDQKFILSFGGSGGAGQINGTFMEMIGQFNGNEKVKLCHVAGRTYYERFVRQVRDLYPELKANVEILAYAYNMDVLMGAADLVISRAGAISLAEISTVGIPSVLIPSPNVANNHQVFNAMVMKNHQAAIMIEEKDLDAIRLSKEIEELVFDSEKLQEMKKNALDLSMAEAIDRIYETISEV